MIKQSKGSHKYSFTFTIIDPYRSVPSMSVPVVWFFNHLDDIATAKLSQSERRNMPTNNPMEVYQMHVGDIVVLENVQSQVFHGFPQILAREERSRITVIRSKQAYDTGKLVDIRDTSHWKMIPASTEGPARPVLAKDRWSVKSYGKKLPISNSNLSTYFSKIVLKLTSWTEHHMKAISLADGTSVVHTNIDGLYQLLGVPLDVALDNPVSPTQSFATFYNEIPNPAPAIGNAPSDSLMPLKIYDAVFLILEVIYGEGDKPTELVVWDGSSRGLLTQGQPQTPLHPLIANVASEAVKIQEYTAVIENCLQAPLKYSNITIHPPAASSSSSSSNATVNNTAAILAQLHTNKTVGTSGNIENRGYLGVPLVLRGLEPSLNHFIGRCSAGQWVRIRSMSSPIIVLDPQQSHRDLYAKKAYYFIRNDTHITPLHPFQR